MKKQQMRVMVAVLSAVLAAWGGAAAAAVSLDEAVAAAQRGSGVREIVVRSGVYRLTHPVVLDARASDVTLRAEKPGGVVLSGGRAIGGWTREKGSPLVFADVPEAKGGLYFRWLVVNGKPAERAEYPGGGRRLSSTRNWTVAWLNSVGGGWERAPTLEELCTVPYRPDDLPPSLDLSSADIRVYHSWDDSLARVQGRDAVRPVIRLREPTVHPAGAFGNRDYVLYNVREGLQKPGQWYLDTGAGRVWYWPRDGEALETIRAEYPVASRLLVLDGKDGAKPIRNLTLEGIAFACTRPEGRPAFGATEVSATIEGGGLEGCRFERLSVSAAGGIGLSVTNAPGCRVAACSIADSGACALVARGDGLTVVSNRLLRTGRLFTGACGASVSGADVRFCANEIRDVPYCGVCFDGDRHLYEDNRVRRVMTLQHDGAAFYGDFSAGYCTLRRNDVRDIEPNGPGAGCAAFYFDEGAHDGLIESNVTDGVAAPLQHHMSRRLVMRGNVFANRGNLSVSLMKCFDCRLEGNAFLTDGQVTCRGAQIGVRNAWLGNRRFAYAADGVRRGAGEAVAGPPEMPRLSPRKEALPAQTLVGSVEFDGSFDASAWPYRWLSISHGPDYANLANAPVMVRAAHDEESVYVAVRLSLFRHEKLVATGPRDRQDHVRVDLGRAHVTGWADGTSDARAAFCGYERRPNLAFEFGKTAIFVFRIPFADIGVEVPAGRKTSVPFNVTVHNGTYGETRYWESPSAATPVPGRLEIDRPGDVSLSGTWRLDYFPQPEKGAVRTLALPPHKTVRATVPGNCELDLVNAGVLPEPEVGLNARAFRRYEGYQWLYTRSFIHADEGGGVRRAIVFDGIDTLADVFLNGEKIGETANMFVRHSFDVTDRLKIGTNVVQVLLRSVLMDGRTRTYGLLGNSMQGGTDGEGYRKACHMGGWDIFPRLFVSGLWRDVRLAATRRTVVDHAHWMVANIDYDVPRADLVGTLRLNMPFSEIDRAKCEVRLTRNGRPAGGRDLPAHTYHLTYEMCVMKPDLWWPRGCGEPAMYDATVSVRSGSGCLLARHRERIGLREIELVRDDVYGPSRPGQFLFKVNRQPVYVRGANWVPVDALPGRSAARMTETLEMFRDLNCNMVRVWGGGVYEPDAFFDWCDENGLMVWQDFAFACSMFPLDPAFQREVREEALATVLRYRNHPSLALWCGNNENDGMPGWKNLQNWDPASDVTSRETIRRVTQEFDPKRPYLPSSPYLSPDVAAGRAKASEGHLWGERGWYKVPAYTNSPCWFASEMGYHGCPNRASLELMMTKDCVYPWSKVTGTDPRRGFKWNPEWQFKASDPWMDGFGQERNALMTKQVKLMFGEVPLDLDDFIFASQTVQAEAMKTFVELFRSQKFTRKNGLVWWNVRDGWPQISDAVVDWYGGRKRAYYAIRDAQRDQLVLVRDDHRVFAVNDTLKPVRGRAKIVDRDSGRTVFEKSYEVPANASAEIGAVPFAGQGVLDIVYEQGGMRATNRFLYGEPPFDLEKTKAWMRQ